MNEYFVFAIPLILLWAWLLPVGFTNRRAEGALVQMRPIPLLARIKRHAVPHTVAIAVTIALVIAGVASAWWLLITLASFAAIIAVPQKYVVTTTGIRTGHGNFRRWTEFAGVYRSRAGARLQTISRGPDVLVWLSGDLGDDEFVHLLRTLVRDSYKGKMTVVTQTPIAGREANDASGLSGIAAFKQNH